MSEASLNLSGLWHGRYAYPRGQSPVAFTATLTEIDGWLSGSIEEKAAVGRSAAVTLTAALQGRRTGYSVTWLKLYEGAPATYDTVHYEGDVSADGTEISGRWTIPGAWSGTFLMIRPSGTGAKSSVKSVERA